MKRKGFICLKRNSSVLTGGTIFKKKVLNHYQPWSTGLRYFHIFKYSEYWEESCKCEKVAMKQTRQRSEEILVLCRLYLCPQGHGDDLNLLHRAACQRK